MPRKYQNSPAMNSVEGAVKSAVQKVNKKIVGRKLDIEKKQEGREDPIITVILPATGSKQREVLGIYGASDFGKITSHTVKEDLNKKLKILDKAA